MAFGFSEGAKAMERRLSGAEPGAFLIAKDIAGDPGFAAKRDGSMALRHEFGATGVTVSGETGNVWQEIQTSATGSPYRWTSVAVDRSFGSNWLSAGISRLDEKQTLLGGRMGDALGGGGANSLFLDLEARREFGGGWSADADARGAAGPISPPASSRPAPTASTSPSRRARRQRPARLPARPAAAGRERRLRA